MPKTRQELAEYCREWRKTTCSEKRFNKCLREYVENKYNDLFSQFKVFYRELDQANPQHKDITKTKQFKAWKKEQQQQRNVHLPQRSDSENDEINVQSSDSENDRNNVHLPQRSDSENDEINVQSSDSENDRNNVHLPQRSDSENDEINVQLPQSSDSENNQQNTQESDNLNDQRNDDILSQALDRPLSPDNITIDQMDNMLREMIGELQQDDNIRALLENEDLFPPQDEGIDLDVEMEIDYPFQEDQLW